MTVRMVTLRDADAAPDRARITEGVVARFRAKPFRWDRAATCVHLARAQLAAFGHHVPPVPRFRSPLSAERALRGLGFETLEALIDDALPGSRIAPARMVVGDIGMLPGRAPFNALVVAAGGGKFIGWSERAPGGLRNLYDVSGNDFVAAWAVGR